MREKIPEMLGVLIVLLLVLGLVGWCTGCRRARAGNDAAEAAYGAALLQCVDKAKSLEESRACRARVDAAWHVERKDGGP